MSRPMPRRRRASFSSAWSRPDTGAAKRSSCSSASGSALAGFVVLSRFSPRRASRLRWPCAAGLRAAEHGARADGQAAAAPDPAWPARRARPPRGQRRSGTRPRSGAAARRRRAGLRSPGSVRRAAADQPRAARGHRRAARRCTTWRTAPAWTTSVARRDARADRQVRHERRAVAARALRHAPHEAAAARGRSGREDRREDGVPAGHLHLSGDLGRDARSGGDQVHPGSVSDGDEHDDINDSARRRLDIPTPGSAGADDARGRRARAPTRRAAAHQDAVHAARRPVWSSPIACGCRIALLEPLVERARAERLVEVRGTTGSGSRRLSLRADRRSDAIARGSTSTRTSTSARRPCRSPRTSPRCAR